MNRLSDYFLSKVDGFATSSSVLEGVFSKTYPSFLTLKEGSTFHLGLLLSWKKRKTALSAGFSTSPSRLQGELHILTKPQ